MPGIAYGAALILRYLTATRFDAQLERTLGQKVDHPVLIDLSYRNELLNLDSQKGLRNFFEAHRREVQRLPVESPFVARDMDTWEDYLRLHQDVFGRPPDGDLSQFS